MKIPSSINVLGKKWKVKRLKTCHDSDGKIVDGTACFKDKTITLTKDAPNEIEIFIHEWLHAIWFESGIEDELPDKLKFLEHWAIIPAARDMVENQKIFYELLKPQKKRRIKNGT